MLLAADVVAIAGTFLVVTLVTQLSSPSLQLRWLSIGLQLLLVGAKLFGLYDRDKTLLRKTTLDEVPKPSTWRRSARWPRGSGAN
jgi:hypothetical protein